MGHDKAAQELHWQCPECRRRLAPDRGTAIRKCDCGEYPQIDGVLTIKSRDRSGEELQDAVRHIREAGRDGAMEWIRRWCTQEGSDLDALRRVLNPRGTTGSFFLDDWQRHARCGREHYFILRWACPSYLANLALLPVMAGRRVLDLGGGVGHLAHLLASAEPMATVVVADGTLLHLLVARAYFAPGTEAVCLDLDEALPFPDASFDVVVLNDCFHYVDNQQALLDEASRILTRHGHLLLVHVHDPQHLVGERVPGSPVEPGHCRDMVQSAFGHATVRLTWEVTLLDAFYRRQGFLGAFQDLPNAEPATGSYIVWACNDQRTLWTAECLRPVVYPRPADLDSSMVNPVYDVGLADGTLLLTLRWPDAASFEEFAPACPLPEQVTLCAGHPRNLVRQLCQQGVLIPDPGGMLGPAFCLP